MARGTCVERLIQNFRLSNCPFPLCISLLCVPTDIRHVSQKKTNGTLYMSRETFLTFFNFRHNKNVNTYIGAESYYFTTLLNSSLIERIRYYVFEMPFSQWEGELDRGKNFQKIRTTDCSTS